MSITRSLLDVFSVSVTRPIEVVLTIDDGTLLGTKTLKNLSKRISILLNTKSHSKDIIKT